VMNIFESKKHDRSLLTDQEGESQSAPRKQSKMRWTSRIADAGVGFNYKSFFNTVSFKVIMVALWVIGFGSNFWFYRC
jgi:hypothetical protein